MLRQITLQDSVVYGPVQSRRLGSSLGINPLPVSYKLCSSNCVYCQYGWTVVRPAAHDTSSVGSPAAAGTSSPGRISPARSPARIGLARSVGNPSIADTPSPARIGLARSVGNPSIADTPSPARIGLARSLPTHPPEAVKRAPELLALIEDAFQAHAQRGTPVDCITLAGNGEPTLHPDLEALVAGLKRLRDRYFPRAKVGILSDATQVHRPEVAHALGQLDVRYMKVDAGDEATWRRINLPLGGADWTRMIEGLKRLPNIILQSMFIQGSYENTNEAHVERWIELVATLHPWSVQVYTVDRAPADAGIRKVPRERLEAIASLLTERTGIPAEVYE